MARRLGWLVGRWLTACAVLTGVLMAAGSAGATPLCSWKVYGPQERSIGHSTFLVAKATFWCRVPYRGTPVTVALQQRAHGHWTNVAVTHKSTNVAAGHSFTVRASVACQPALGFTGVMIRTFSAARPRAGRVVMSSPPDNSLCSFG